MKVNSRGTHVIVCSYISVLISALFTSLRLFVRWRLVKIIGREDACIFFAWIAALACAITMHLDVTMGGLGQRLNTLTPTQFITHFKMTYLSILFYNMSLCLSKFAILLFCQRLFAPSSWRKAYLVTLTCIGIYTAWAVATSIVPCVPVRRYWDKTVQGRCLPNEVLWFLNAGLNIVSDFVVVLLPIPTVFALRLPRKQKIGVSLVFGLGLFVCIISIVRLHALSKIATATDFTYDAFDIALWTCIEVNGAIVGACLPMLKPLVNKLWPRLLSSGRSRPGAEYVFSANKSKRHTIRLEDIATEGRNFESAEEILRNDGVELNVREGGKGVGRGSGEEV